ncbi:tetratricopeptide repeat protein [Rhabdochlamydiaceae symbiont of Dictyostelium giganteum]|uniref:tetratricopeptide repeat protein n=1 Tax=Rhabdochlamydiaceae symbiont of Dictyostelium giganteum TaxID=3342349 RepID=UPI00384CB2CA
MTIRPYSSIEAPSQQALITPHQEDNLSSSLETLSHERPSKQLRVEAFSSDQKEAPLPQLDQSLKIEQIAEAILRVDQNHVDPNRALLGSKSEAYKKCMIISIHAIHLDPRDANAYSKLARCLKDNEMIKLLNGETYTKRALYIKAIDLDPNQGYFYGCLTDLIGENETIQLLNGEIYTERALYIKAIGLNSKDEHSYYNLASLMEKNETIQLLNGEIYTKRTLYIKLIDLNPKDKDSYYSLALLLKKGERIQLLNHERCTAIDLCLKAIDLDSQYKNAYYYLAMLFEDDESIELLNGKMYTSKELYVQVINLDPEYCNAYFNLATLLEQEESIQFLNNELYTAIDLYLKVIDLDPQCKDAYYYLATLLREDETLQLLNGKSCTVRDFYLKVLDLDPENTDAYCLLAKLLKKTEKIQFLNGEFFTKKELFLKAIGEDLTHPFVEDAKESLKQIYIQEIEENPQNIENYFDLITVIKHNTPYSGKIEELRTNPKNTFMESLFRKAIDLDPFRAFSAQFAPAFFSMGSLLHRKTVSILNNLNTKITTEDLTMREVLLKEGTSIALKSHKVLSTKDIYHHALSYLPSSYLKRRGDQEVGHYLSSIKPISLQDGVKFTPLMAYVYAYQKSPLQSLLIKIGDALHPEERVLLNDQLYDKRTCYAKVSHHEDSAFFLRQAESLYPYDYLKQEELISNALKYAYTNWQEHWESYITLARILSQDTFKKLSYKYLLIFEECLESYKNLTNKKITTSIKEHHKSLNSPYTSKDLEDRDINEDLYFAKKQQFLLELLNYLPACEEAYVALATSFQDPLMIHEKNYPSKESLYLKAIAINPEYSLPYFLLGKELFNQKIETIQLLNGVILSSKQLLMRSIQLGIYKAEAYHLAALLMGDKEGIALFDEKTLLSRGDLFIRAFELDSHRVMDLKNFISYVKRVSLKS